MSPASDFLPQPVKHRPKRYSNHTIKREKKKRGAQFKVHQAVLTQQSAAIPGVLSESCARLKLRAEILARLMQSADGVRSVFVRFILQARGLLPTGTNSKQNNNISRPTPMATAQTNARARTRMHTSKHSLFIYISLFNISIFILKVSL